MKQNLQRFSRFFVGIIFYLREVLLTLHYEKRLFEHASQPRVGSVVILGGLTFVNFPLCIHLC